ncbi:MAG: hypothetical protein ACTSRP_03700 [Candidatus Helarchaeota archaeon]
MVNLRETVESQERIINKQDREIRRLKLEIQRLENELIETKKQAKIKELELKNKIKDQAREIADLKIASKQGTAEYKEISKRQIKHQEHAMQEINALNSEILKLKKVISAQENKIELYETQISEKEIQVQNLKEQLNAREKAEMEVDLKMQKELEKLKEQLQKKELLLEKQNDAINKLTLDLKKKEVEIAELEYKLSNLPKNEPDENLKIQLHESELLIKSLRRIIAEKEEKINSLLDSQKEMDMKIYYYNIKIND